MSSEMNERFEINANVWVSGTFSPHNHGHYGAITIPSTLCCCEISTQATRGSKDDVCQNS